MKVIHKSYKFKIAPDNEQKKLLAKHFGACRFVFNLLLKLNGKQIIVINNSNEDKQDLINDLVSIIYSFSARLYGLRKRKNKEEVISFLKK